MKLAVASLVLALVQGATASTTSSKSAAGQCLSAASSYASSNANGNATQYQNANDQASYYVDTSNIDSYEIESNFAYNLGGLAETLGIEFDYEGDDDAAEQDGQQDIDLYQTLATQGHVMAYDEELAEALGLYDQDDFAKFYFVLYDLAFAGRSCGSNQQQGDDLVTSIIRNCGDVFYAFGVDLSNMDLGDDDDNQDNDQLSESLQELSLHVRIEMALDKIDTVNAYSGTDAADTNYENVLTFFDDVDLDDEAIRDIQVKLAIKAGALQGYLETYAGYGIVVDDWEGLLQKFFYSIGIDGEYELGDVDPYLAAEIYNAEYDVLEAGCQAAMIDQFGEDEAIDLGYVTDKAKGAVKTFLDSVEGCVNNLSTGAIVGIAIAVLAVVLLIAFLTYKCGRSKAATDKKAPLIDIDDKESVHSETSAEV